MNLHANIEEETNKILEEATIKFFPKSGEWRSHCFRKPKEHIIGNLPCHLRDEKWLAHTLQDNQELYNTKYKKILEFVKTSDFFKEQRHIYEQRIVKWQIEWMYNGGEHWIVDENLGGDLYMFGTLCDEAFRKGVVDTLTAIGMNIEAIEEGIEKNADIWRNFHMSHVFSNIYEPIFFMSNIQIEPAAPEHREKWIKMRKYEYYKRHKKSVDMYSPDSEELKMSDEEAYQIRRYLEEKHQERMIYIEECKKFPTKRRKLEL